MASGEAVGEMGLDQLVRTLPDAKRRLNLSSGEPEVFSSG